MPLLLPLQEQLIVIEELTVLPMNSNIEQNIILNINLWNEAKNNFINNILINQQVTNEYPEIPINQEIGKFCNTNEFDDGANAEEYANEVINVSTNTSILSLALTTNIGKTTITASL